MVKDKDKIKENEEQIGLDTCNIKNLRLYESTEDNKLYFINGFALSVRTGRTMVIYSDVKLGIIYTRDTKDFTEIIEGKTKFKLIE